MPETFPTPPTLPKPTLSMAINTQPAVVRTKFETGRARQRRRFEYDTKFYRVEWELTDSEYDIFEAFVRTKLNFGNDWFNITLPATQGLQTVLARFKDGKHKRSHYGNLNWRVTATLEVEADYGLTEAELDALLP